MLKEKDILKFYEHDTFGKIVKKDDSDDLIGACVDRAYRDFCRTITFYTSESNKEGKKKKSHSYLMGRIKEIINGENSIEITDQKDFDKWHFETCDELKELMSQQEFYFGQAQKWVNMSLKYLAILDGERIKPIYKYCHVLTDKTILDKTEYEKFDTSWSRINDYGKYMEFQKCIREECKDRAPLDMEFELWLSQGSSRE